MVSAERQGVAFQGACFVLGFLVNDEQRLNARKSMPGFSDAAIFHRWMGLAWTFRDSEAIELLNAEEVALLKEFNSIYESIEWRPIESHPFISDAPVSQLKRIEPVAAQLLRLFELRSGKSN